MARKKTVIVHEYESSRRGWVLKVQGTDPAVRDDLIAALRTSTEKNDIVIANAKDPFGEAGEIKVAKKRKARKLPSAAAAQQKGLTEDPAKRG